MLQALGKLQQNVEQEIEHPRDLAGARRPAYATKLGAAYAANGLSVMMDIPAESIDLIVTSPPYALEFKKEYGNVAKERYIDWFLPFASEIKRILKPQGSFVLNIGGSYNAGSSRLFVGALSSSMPSAGLSRSRSRTSRGITVWFLTDTLERMGGRYVWRFMLRDMTSRRRPYKSLQFSPFDTFLIVPFSLTSSPNMLQGLPLPERERGRFPRAEPYTPHAPGRSGNRPRRHYDRRARCLA